MTTQIRICKLYSETVTTHSTLIPLLVKFMTAKVMDPLSAYGGSDTHFTPDGPIGKTGLKVKHAHLSQDVSVIYRLHGGNPRFLDIYGLFSHKESGTGNASNIRTQQKLANKLPGQDFTPIGQDQQAPAQQQKQKKRF